MFTANFRNQLQSNGFIGYIDFTTKDKTEGGFYYLHQNGSLWADITDDESLTEDDLIDESMDTVRITEQYMIDNKIVLGFKHLW